MKAILLARVSTEEQKEAGNSLPAQVERLKKYCHNKNFEIIKICSFDESAYSNKRNEFDKIIDFVLNHEDKVALCCDKVDRLTRNTFDKRVAQLYDKALQDKIELHFVSDGQILTSQISAVEKFQFNISLGLAKYYSDAISDNVKRAQEQMVRKGIWVAKAPIGYQNITDPNGNKTIIVDEYHGPIVTKIFEMYATGAYSLQLIIDSLDKNYGIKVPKGFIGKALSNPFYYGTMIVKGVQYPHSYPPIISKDLFDKVQAVKASYKKKPAKHAGRPYIYRGLMRCGDCGLAITPEMHKGYVYYHCTQYKGKHGAKWFREEAITSEVEKIFKRMHIPEEILQQVTDELNVMNQDRIEFHNNQLQQLIKEQKRIAKMLDNLYLDKLEGRITVSQYDKFYQTLKEQISEVNQSLQRLHESDENYYITSQYLLQLASKSYELFKSSEVEEKRVLIKTVLSNFEITGENMLWKAKKPFSNFLNCTEGFLWRHTRDALRTFNWKKLTNILKIILI
tara:strand:- start:2236 stop:3759 length:1524 start_codon:yes stop_codon:yes gene_type:complete